MTYEGLALTDLQIMETMAVAKETARSSCSMPRTTT